MNFFHNFSPQAVAFSFGPINIYWYGLLIVIGIIAGIIIAAKLAESYNIKKDIIYDLAFYLVIFAILGARIYDCLLEWHYYSQHPLDVFKIWQGGLAIHGSLIAGMLVIYYFAKKHSLGFLPLASSLVPGLALGQAIGRWGNFFNQELFGQPTDKPWGIFIRFINRPQEFKDYQYFHPTFLYESLASLLLFGLLVLAHKKLANSEKHLYIVSTYLVGYSLIRFSLEFIRIDRTPLALGLRWPQLASLAIILAVIIFDYLYFFKKHDGTLAKN